jgi:zinc-binding alcohol dehydrogenase family protein
MKSVGYFAKGGIDKLVPIELPRPHPRPRDLLVEVRAVSVNPVDVKRRRWEDPDEDSKHRILGYDAAGVVEAVGTEVTLFKPGDEVFYAGAMDRPGTNSEFHLVDERLVGPKPRSLSFSQAAALPLTSITAWEILFDRMKVPFSSKAPCGTLVILNGAGGVGSMLTQLASRLTGLTVISTASRPESREWVEKLGAHYVADHTKPLDEALNAIGFGEVDYVAAITTTPGSAPALVRVLKPHGHIALVDNFSESISPFKAKSITLSWEMMFTHSLFQTRNMNSQNALLREVSSLIDDNVLQTTLTQVVGPMDVDTLRAAHQLVETGRTIGKVVLERF